jgi:hypothetical protein
MLHKYIAFGMLYTTDKGRKPQSDDFAARRNLAAKEAVASSKPWCFKSRIDPDKMLEDAAIIGAIADDNEARGSIEMRMLAIRTENAHTIKPLHSETHAVTKSCQ